jgi:hypothetical protein
MAKKTNTHEHEFKEVVTKVQEAIIKRWDYQDHLITTLVHEKITLFCIKCGENKELSIVQSYAEEGLSAINRPNDKMNEKTKCDICGATTDDVSYRPNAYANDVHNDPTAYHTVCDECDYQNRMDI